jgi:NAD(P)-dependent dehydrogenase (short-subunit alcohol dehydrogenase family)
MIVERRDGSLWMLVRTNYGIGETVSTDQGRTWAPITPTALPHTPTRFFLRRLVSGRLLLVKHGPLTGKPVGRKQLMAYLSDDDGRTWQGGINVPGYAASQGGVGQLTQAFANEWAGRGVNVDAIAPGYAATDNTQALRDNPVRSQQILSRIPAGRWATPEDFQGVAVFLASDASAYLHGGGVISLGGRCRARNVAFGYGVPLLIS